MLAKIYIGTLAATVWVAAIVGKHFWPDIDTAAIVLACSNVLTGLGVYHVAGPAQPLPQPERRPDMGQGGFVRFGVLAVLAAIALVLAGCASINDAGHDDYEVKANTTGTHDLKVRSGKEYGGPGRVMTFDAIHGRLMVQEGPSKAFRGQALAVKAASLLPTMGLGDILAPQDK
jgi:hypothetical protein